MIFIFFIIYMIFCCFFFDFYWYIYKYFNDVEYLIFVKFIKNIYGVERFLVVDFWEIMDSIIFF